MLIQFNNGHKLLYLAFNRENAITPYHFWSQVHPWTIVSIRSLLYGRLQQLPLFIHSEYVFAGWSCPSIGGFFFLLFSISKKVASRKTRIIGTSRATFIVFFIADLAIRLLGIVQTYSEQSDGNYFSLAEQEKLDS